MCRYGPFRRFPQLWIEVRVDRGDKRLNGLRSVRQEFEYLLLAAPSVRQVFRNSLVGGADQRPMSGGDQRKLETRHALERLKIVRHGPAGRGNVDGALPEDEIPREQHPYTLPIKHDVVPRVAGGMQYLKPSAIDRDPLPVPERRLGARPPSDPGSRRVRESIRRALVIVVMVSEENQPNATAGGRGIREHMSDMRAVIRPRVDDYDLPAGAKHVGVCSLKRERRWVMGGEDLKRRPRRCRVPGWARPRVDAYRSSSLS